jgi:hypothetical protein
MKGMAMCGDERGRRRRDVLGEEVGRAALAVAGDK